MIKGVTPSGFSYEIDEVVVDDVEFLDMLVDLEEGESDMDTLPQLCRKLLGRDQAKQLYRHCRNEEKRAPLEAVAREIRDIMNGAGAENVDVKN